MYIIFPGGGMKQLRVFLSSFASFCHVIVFFRFGSLFLCFRSKISDCIWPCRSVAITLVIWNPLNARTFFSKAKLPNLVLCALLGKCPVALSCF